MRTTEKRSCGFVVCWLVTGSHVTGFVGGLPGNVPIEAGCQGK